MVLVFDKSGELFIDFGFWGLVLGEIVGFGKVLVVECCIVVVLCDCGYLKVCIVECWIMVDYSVNCLDVMLIVDWGLKVCFGVVFVFGNEVIKLDFIV